MVSTRGKRLSGASEEDTTRKATLRGKIQRHVGPIDYGVKRRRGESLTTGKIPPSKKRRSPKSDTSVIEPQPIQIYKEPLAAFVTADGFHSNSTISSPPSPSSNSGTAIPLTTTPPDHQNGGHLVAQKTIVQDINAILNAILDHSHRVDEVIQQYKADWGEIDTTNLPMVEANLRLKVQGLSILDNLATQILNLLAKGSYAETVMTVTHPESEGGQIYVSIKNLFDHARKVYSARGHFLDSTKTGLLEITQIETLRKANLATFVSSIFGSRDVGFYYLNEYFLDTFVGNGNRLLKSQANLFLELKTQAYISAMSSGEGSKEEILNDLFPLDLEQRLLSRKHAAKQLAPSELEFIKRARYRCKALQDEPDTKEAIAALPDKYDWEVFLKETRSYVSKHFDAIVGVGHVSLDRSRWLHLANLTEDHRKKIRVHESNDIPVEPLQQQSFVQQIRPVHPSQSQLFPPEPQLRSSIEASNGIPMSYHPGENTKEVAHHAGFAMQGFGAYDGYLPQPPHSDPHFQLQPQPQPQHYPPHFPQHLPYPTQFPHPALSLHPHQPISPHAHPPQVHYQLNHHNPLLQAPPPPGYYHPHPQMIGHPNLPLVQQVYPDQNGIPYPTQSAPTQVLYERARMVSTAKSVPPSRRAGNLSQRRPWSTDEENALMAGLDRVKGPHWSQILALFGPGGTINETLKDRNQVQLKDKARNLKLFFLKSDIEVPYYLQFVTGELKTRAPAQAAKSEGKNKADTSEDHEDEEGMTTTAEIPEQTGDDTNNGVDIGTSFGPFAIDDVTGNVNGGMIDNAIVENEEQKPFSSIVEYQVSQVRDMDQVLVGTEDPNTNQLQFNTIQPSRTDFITNISEQPPPVSVIVDGAKEAAFRAALLAAQNAAMDTTDE